MLSSITVEFCVEVLKCHILICISFVYLTKQCRSQAYLNDSFYISKSFYVSEFGKVAVTLTPLESSFFRALAMLKLYTGLQYPTYLLYRRGVGWVEQLAVKHVQALRKVDEDSQAGKPLLWAQAARHADWDISFMLLSCEHLKEFMLKTNFFFKHSVKKQTSHVKILH